MDKYVIFYYLDSDFNYVYIDAESLEAAFVKARDFSYKFGVTVVGICPVYLLNSWHHE